MKVSIEINKSVTSSGLKRPFQANASQFQDPKLVRAFVGAELRVVI